MGEVKRNHVQKNSKIETRSDDPNPNPPESKKKKKKQTWIPVPRVTRALVQESI